ncbi:MAG TPA: hypothetical protein VFA65_24210 [Bryobacteraceae bacterium]|nr:hypothetical protein [Bryobacteraceae bacterium]
MKHRHKHHEKKKDGGKADYYAGGDSNVRKEAEGEERKHGGSVHAKVKKHSMHHMKAEGGRTKHHQDKFRRGGRAKGGRTGADQHPLSSAAKVHHVGSDAGEHVRD